MRSSTPPMTASPGATRSTPSTGVSHGAVIVRPGQAGAPVPRAGPQVVVKLSWVLALLAAVCSGTGLLVGGGIGRHEVMTIRGETVTLFGDGVYAADNWLVGAGARGQDVAILLFEIPLLLAVLAWYRRGGRVAATVLTGVLAFFTYYYVSLVFGTAQNRLFPAYVAAASVAGFGLLAVARRLDGDTVATDLPDRPGNRVLMTYLAAVAAALSAAWLPGMLSTALSGDVAEAVGPYTSAATEALDLGVVVPVAVITAVSLHRRNPGGRPLALVMLVVNVCIGVVLLAQGIAQLAYDVPLTMGEIVGKSLTFLALTLVAGGLLARWALHRPDTEVAESGRTGS